VDRGVGVIAVVAGRIAVAVRVSLALDTLTVAADATGRAVDPDTGAFILDAPAEIAPLSLGAVDADTELDRVDAPVLMADLLTRTTARAGLDVRVGVGVCVAVGITVRVTVRVRVPTSVDLTAVAVEDQHEG
jgi:hypothetical protein